MTRLPQISQKVPTFMGRKGTPEEQTQRKQLRCTFVKIINCIVLKELQSSNRSLILFQKAHEWRYHRDRGGAGERIELCLRVVEVIMMIKDRSSALLLSGVNRQ